jgi:hypothetical protein
LLAELREALVRRQVGGGEAALEGLLEVREGGGLLARVHGVQHGEAVVEVHLQAAALLGVLNGAVESQRSGKAFEPALDGDLLAGGDFVRANKSGRGFLTFFDGSTLSIEPASEVKVLALARTSGDGLQVTIEQSAGRTWASVQKLVTPDSRFELRTPSMTAIVRGTTFETIVERRPDGTTTPSILSGEVEFVAKAEAGGETRVPAGT